MICEGTDDGKHIKVNVGSGLSDWQRDEFWEQKEKMIGMIAEVRADAITQNQVTQFEIPRSQISQRLCRRRENMKRMMIDAATILDDPRMIPATQDCKIATTYNFKFCLFQSHNLHLGNCTQTFGLL